MIFRLLRRDGRLEVPASSPTPAPFALCAFFKNEARYLKEWIEFYRLMGVDRFYLYNNNSSDNYREVLEPYLKSGIVRLHQWRGKNGQVPGFNQCLQRYGALHKWMAFLDLDEFLFPVSGGNLAEFLKDFDEYAGLAAHWVFFGTSGHILRPEGLVTQSYDWSQGVPNRHVKLVIQPAKVVRFVNAHLVDCKDGFHVVNENKQPVTTAIVNPASAEKIRINHYWCRSVEDYLRKKMPDGRVALGGEISINLLFKAEKKYRLKQDLSIFRFIPELMRRLTAIES